ncbi:phage holin family protein [Qipengyuania gelatinilytica]|uniref:Phage holin family protein n=1 Tax=Qipengyuania gelatinilytica TaxID=2867231 RepID=A0ABX9A2L8_9SPHN|nr:phage holin family protein [Qipengyuania gelatinilytica]QZD95510.1 phage holin family protein [Qipengyuania gelatinilytica]
MVDSETQDRADYEGPLDLPDDYDPEEDGEGQHGPSLTDDLFALLEDGKTYAEAEVAYQKSRAGFTANRLKGAIAFGLGAFGVLHLALISFTVGAVIALMPLLGPWGATGVVTLALIIAGVVLLMLLKGRIDDIRDAFTDGNNE